MSNGSSRPNRREGPDIPIALDAERALLGAIMLNEAAFWDVADFIAADQFFLVAHRWIWEAFAALKESRHPIDLVTVSEELERRGQLTEIGGPIALSKLTDDVPSSIHAEAYGRTIEAAALRRALIAAASAVAKEAYDEKQPVEDAIEKAERALLAVGERRVERDVFRNREIATEYHDQIMARREKDSNVLGARSGFLDLDALLGGLAPGYLIVLAGRPAMGKTALGLQIGLNVSRQAAVAGDVLFFSLEMSRLRLFNRLVAMESGLGGHALERGRIPAPSLTSFSLAVGKIGDLRMTLCDPAGLTPLGVRTRCRRIAGERGLSLVVVDYLQLLHVPGQTDEYTEVSIISRQMKQLARELDVPVLLLSQLNRQVESRRIKEPLLSDLRGSGSIEQDADVVMLLYRDDYYNEQSDRPNVAQVEVAKNRDGPQGKIELWWNPETTSFANLAKRVVGGGAN